MFFLQGLLETISSSRHSRKPTTRRILDSERDCSWDSSNLVFHHDMTEYDLCDFTNGHDLCYGRDVRQVESRHLKTLLPRWKLILFPVDKTTLDHDRHLTPSVLGFDVLRSHTQFRQFGPKCWTRRGSIQLYDITSSDIHVLPPVHKSETASQHACAAPNSHEQPQPGRIS